MSSHVYLKMPGFTGTVSAAEFVGQIECYNPYFSVSQNLGSAIGSDNNRMKGVPSMSEFTFTKARDPGSVSLWSAMFKKLAIPTAMISWVQTDLGGYAYQTLELEDVLISSMSSTTQGEEVRDSVSLNYVKMTMTGKTMDASNTPTDNRVATWDGAAMVGS